MCVHRETGAQRAVKVLRKSHMDEDEKKMLFNEINILRELVSPPVLLLLGAPYFIYYLLHYERAYLSKLIRPILNFFYRTTLILSRCMNSLKMRSVTTL
jgi:hypothetical protein